MSLLKNILFPSNFPLRREEFMETKTKPTLDEVLKETDKKVAFWLFKLAYKLPPELKDEIKQNARLEIFEYYEKIEAVGWKSLLNRKCMGFVIDYHKQRKGLISFGKKMKRAESKDSNGEDIPIDSVIEKYGVLDKKESCDVDIKWDLLAKLASSNLQLKAFVKNKVIGIKLEDLGPHFNIEITRVNQLVQEFISNFEYFKAQTKKIKKTIAEEFSDDQLIFSQSEMDLIENEFHEANGDSDYFWLKQCCFALGLCKTLDIPDRPVYLNDSKGYIGQHLNPIDLWDDKPCQAWLEKQSQMTLFEK